MPMSPVSVRGLFCWCVCVVLVYLLQRQRLVFVSYVELQVCTFHNNELYSEAHQLAQILKFTVSVK